MPTDIPVYLSHPNTERLRALYADLTRVGDYAAEDIVYHPAERDTPQGASDIHGREAVVAKEQALFKATGGTLFADIEAVIANDQFGVVMGVFRIGSERDDKGMPFCGLWRFNKNGLVTDHWQNAYHPSAAAALYEALEAEQ